MVKWTGVVRRRSGGVSESSGSSVADGRGNRRLLVFGVGAIVIAFISAGLSLLVYTISGDLYLDRTRPGFISENEGGAENPPAEQLISFPNDGAVTSGVLEEYLDQLDKLQEDINVDPGAFSGDALSDETLNILAPRE